MTFKKGTPATCNNEVKAGNTYAKQDGPEARGTKRGTSPRPKCIMTDKGTGLVVSAISVTLTLPVY